MLIPVCIDVACPWCSFLSFEWNFRTKQLAFLFPFSESLVDFLNFMWLSFYPIC